MADVEAVELEEVDGVADAHADCEAVEDTVSDDAIEAEVVKVEACESVGASVWLGVRVE
jgi:hypothetical protein